MIVSRTTPILLLALSLAAPVRAQDADPVTVVIRIARPTDASPAAMRRLRARIDAAALEACGLADGSLVEVKAAIHRSDCWRKGYDGAVAQAGGLADRDVVSISPPRSVDRP